MIFNQKEYLNIFVKILKIDKSLAQKIYKKKINISFNDFKKWDSINHVRILVSLEKKFKIKIDHKNERFFKSYSSGLNYLVKK